MLAYHLRRWLSIKPTLVQCLVFAGLRAGMLVVAAGGEYKPTPPIVCEMLGSVAGAGQYPFSPSQYFMLAVLARCFEPKLG